MSQNREAALRRELEHIKGRYNLAIALIGLLGVIITLLLVPAPDKGISIFCSVAESIFVACQGDVVNYSGDIINPSSIVPLSSQPTVDVVGTAVALTLSAETPVAVAPTSDIMGTFVAATKTASAFMTPLVLPPQPASNALMTCFPAQCNLNVTQSQGTVFTPNSADPVVYSWYFVQESKAGFYEWTVLPVTKSHTCQSESGCAYFGYINGRENALSEAQRVCNGQSAACKLVKVEE